MNKSHLLFFLLLPFFLTACGDADSDHGHAHGADGADGAHGSPADPVDPITVVNGMTIVEMTGNDRMKYNVEAFTVPAGSPVKIIFRNVGKMPKAAMGHNVVFLTADADENVFAAASASARDNDYLPADMMDQILATTKMLGPGESETIEFTAPNEPGEYIFLCSFPAHMFAGMRGVMTVE
jgi:azurin